MAKLRRTRPVVVAGSLIGCGLGAMFDGIVLHQILQWHNMLSNVTPPVDMASMKYNMFWDGVFHAAVWAITAAGVLWLWIVARRSEARFSHAAFGGSLLIGWGGFNLVEGLIDHHLLQLHHVRPGELQHVWDLAFLAWGGLMLAAGALLVRRASHPRRALNLAY